MLFPIYDLATAQNGILKRRSWSETTYPASLLDRLEALFGEALTPEAAVGRILAAAASAAMPPWRTGHGVSMAP